MISAAFLQPQSATAFIARPSFSGSSSPRIEAMVGAISSWLKAGVLDMSVAIITPLCRRNSRGLMGRHMS